MGTTDFVHFFCLKGASYFCTAMYPSPHYPLTLRMYPVKKVTNDVFYLLCNKRRKKDQHRTLSRLLMTLTLLV